MAYMLTVDTTPSPEQRPRIRESLPNSLSPQAVFSGESGEDARLRDRHGTYHTHSLRLTFLCTSSTSLNCRSIIYLGVGAFFPLASSLSAVQTRDQTAPFGNQFIFGHEVS